MTTTNEDLLALADRLEAPRYWLSTSDEGHEGENAAPVRAAAALRAIVAERQKPQAVRIKPLVWKKGEAKTPFGSYYVVCEDWDDEPFWFVIWNGRPAPYLGEHPSEDAAMAAAEADHAARILSQIEAVPAAQIRAEALEEAAALPPYDCDGDPAGSFDHHVFVKRDAIRALIEKENFYLYLCAR